MQLCHAYDLRNNSRKLHDDYNATVEYRIQSGDMVYFGQPISSGATTRPRQLTTLLAAAEETVTASWTSNMTISGNSSVWSELPVSMNISFDIPAQPWSSTRPRYSSALVLASLSRVQAASPDTAVQLQLMVDGVEVAFWQSSSSNGWDFTAPSLHGVVDGLTVGPHTAEVRCRLPEGGTVFFTHDSDREQHRQLTVLRNRIKHHSATSKLVDGCWANSTHDVDVLLPSLSAGSMRFYSEL